MTRFKLILQNINQRKEFLIEMIGSINNIPNIINYDSQYPTNLVVVSYVDVNVVVDAGVVACVGMVLLFSSSVQYD